MQVRYNYRLDPTPGQRIALARTFGCARTVYNDDLRLLADMYEWLRSVVPSSLFNAQATVDVLDKFETFKSERKRVKGANGGQPSHEEIRELMYRICSRCGWWDWRTNRMGKDEFPTVPLAFLDDNRGENR